LLRPTVAQAACGRLRAEVPATGVFRPDSGGYRK